MSPGLTTERVYDALKGQIMRGEHAAGARLDPARLAYDLGASATPVRDALHRLLGEGLVQSRPHEGFRVPILSEADLRDLYAWSRDLLTLALQRASTGTVPAATTARIGEQPLAENITALFSAITARSGNEEHGQAMRHANERLYHARCVEPEMFRNAAREYQAMCEAWQAGATRDLRRMVHAYHRRRIGSVTRIAPLLARRDHPLP